MKKQITIVPAYGRDYKNKSDVIAAWDSNKDFRIQDCGSEYNGAMLNKQDAEKYKVECLCYFNKASKFVILK